MSVLRAIGRRIALAAALCAAPLTAASAHPHAYFWVRVAPEFNEAGQLASVSEWWFFDSDYSEFIATQFHVSNDAVFTVTFTPEELADAGGGALSWIPLNHYFTRVSTGGETIPHGASDGIVVDIRESSLSVQFRVPLVEPQTIGTGTIGIDVFDPEYYFELAFSSRDIDRSDVPAGCTVERRRAIVLDPMAVEVLRRLGLATDPGIANDPAAGYPVRIIVSCP